MKNEEKGYESYVINEEEMRPCTMWSLAPRIMAMPSSGWQKVKENGPLPDIALVRFLLPLCIISGTSEFLKYLYQPQQVFSDLLVGAVINFCSFFLGYFLAILLCQLAFPKDAKKFLTTDYSKLLLMMGVATLALFHIIFMALPMLDFILEFLPLWTIYLLFQGLKKMKVSESKQSYAFGVVCVAVICGPMIVEWALALFV